MQELLTRSSLARRWGVSTTTIDRLRKKGLAWVNLGGSCIKPTVRFRIEDVAAFEQNINNRRIG